MNLIQSQLQNLNNQHVLPKPKWPVKPQKLCLYLVGLNEIFGLEEIVENSQARRTTV
jgi:hypothetical protein